MRPPDGISLKPRSNDGRAVIHNFLMLRRYLVYSAAAVVFVWSTHASAQANRPSPQRPAPTAPGGSAAAPVSDYPNMPTGNAEHGRYIAEHVAMCVECH